MRLLALCLTAAFAAPALAQQGSPAAAPKPKVQHVDFTDTELSARPATPLGSIYTAKPKATFPCLIKVRGNFSDTIDESTDAL
jgi:hypothetical protein